MAYMLLDVEFTTGEAATLEGPNIKFWAGCGLPSYEGSLEGFAKLYPSQLAELLKRGLVKTDDIDTDGMPAQLED